MPVITEQLSADQRLQLLVKRLRGEPRRNLKSFIHDCGLPGTTDALDAILPELEADEKLVKHAENAIKFEKLAAEADPDEGLTGAADVRYQIAHAMQDAGLSQGELAKRIGISRPQISDYLSGKRSPGLDVLARIAAALGMHWQLLPDDAENIKPTSEIEYSNLGHTVGISWVVKDGSSVTNGMDFSEEYSLICNDHDLRAILNVMRQPPK